MKITVDDVDLAILEVGSVEEVVDAYRCECDSRVNRAVHCLETQMRIRSGRGRRHRGTPTGDRAGGRCKDEDRRSTGSARAYDEVVGWVEDLASRRTARDRYFER